MYLDVLDPGLVALDGVDGESDHLASALLKLPVQVLHTAKLGGADRGVVGRVGEEYGPAARKPLVKPDLALVRFSGEVGHYVPKSDGGRHLDLLGELCLQSLTVKMRMNTSTPNSNALACKVGGRKGATG